MTSAGYIVDQRCPTNPNHGRCVDQRDGMFCPHADHHINFTQFFWRFDEWERIKANTPQKLEEPKRVRRHRRSR